MAGGLSYIITDEQGVEQKSVGIGLQAEAFLKAGPFGLGLLFSTLVSPKYFGIGFTLNVHLGKLE